MGFNLLIILANTLYNFLPCSKLGPFQDLKGLESSPSENILRNTTDVSPSTKPPTLKSLSFRKNLSRSFFIIDGKLPVFKNSEIDPPEHEPTAPEPPKSPEKIKERENGARQEQIETRNSSRKLSSEEIEESEKTEEEEESEKLEEISLYNGLPNFGNTCFANSLVQSLYHIESFREGIIRAYHDRLDTNTLLDLLAELFIAMKTGSHNKGILYRNFLGKMFYLRNEFKIGIQGDSSALFRALVEELCGERNIQQIPYLNIFTGEDLNIKKICPDCEAERCFKENIRPLEVMDINFSKENSRRFFKMPTELRRCVECKERGQLKCCYSIEECPEILAVRIQDTQGSRGTVEILESFMIFEGMEKKKKKVEYKFIAGVLNTSKGERGHHSVEVSQIHGRWYQISDDYCEEISCGWVNYHPKILFYQRSSSC